MFELVDNVPSSAVIKVVGVGGGGCNAVKHMIANEMEGVDFICANTDSEALTELPSGKALLLGHSITKGLGTAGNPKIGHKAAMESRHDLQEAMEGADMVFIIAGMGGGTGTGAAPVIAELAHKMGVLTVAVVTTPFPFEGRQRISVAKQGCRKLREHVDTLITIPNEKLLSLLGKQTTLLDAFKFSNDTIREAIQGISDLIVRPGMINVDFADVRTVLSEMGAATIGSGTSIGENRAVEAAAAAIHSPFLEDINIQAARGIMVSVTAGLDLTLGEFTDVGDTVSKFASDLATVIVGSVIDPDMNDELRVTLVATGLDSSNDLPLKGAENTNPRAADDTTNPDHLDIPAFLRRQTDNSDEDSPDIPDLLQRQTDNEGDVDEVVSKTITLVAPSTTSDTKLAEIVEHLSNVYRSVGGDHLEILAVKNLPPSPTESVRPMSSKKRGLASG